MGLKRVPTDKWKEGREGAHHKTHPPAPSTEPTGSERRVKCGEEKIKSKRNKEDGENKENTGDVEFEQGDEERETDKNRKELRGQREASIFIQQDFNSERRKVFADGDGVD